jgi:hypothetical protein
MLLAAFLVHERSFGIGYALRFLRIGDYLG